MPELPEVETVRAGLCAVLGLPGEQPHIGSVWHSSKRLRGPWPRALAASICGARLLGIRRRAKYLLFDTSRGCLLNHLGMTGSWRIGSATLSEPTRLRRSENAKTHDHLRLHLGDGRVLIYHDPRRFGVVDWLGMGSEATHPSLRDLGPEPLAAGFTGAWLHTRWRGKRVAVKAALMDQREVVGVGNIYAAEALFIAGIKPTKPAGRLSATHCDALVAAVRQVLAAAITAGGSTISDYRTADGGSGYFQHHFQVYGKAGEACPRCGARLRHSTIGGRSSVWCATCQK